MHDKGVGTDIGAGAGTGIGKLDRERGRVGGGKGFICLKIDKLPVPAARP